VNSGLPNDRFCFEGFLPVKKGRQTKFAAMAQEKRTMIVYESPYRVLKTLTQLAEVLGPDRKASVSREISKIHEETVRGTLSELVQHFTEHQPKGEFVMIIGGAED
jgi:16S rRNA (cytidine1402-2'-O)-methyltransferase